MIRLLAFLLFFFFVVPLQAQLLDSLKLKHNLNHADSLYSIQLNTLDSIQTTTNQSYLKLKLQADSIGKTYEQTKFKIQSKVDSLGKLNLSTTGLNQKFDSLSQQQIKKLNDIKAKADSIKANTIGKINQLNLPPDLQTKVNEFTSLLDKVDLSLPSTDLQFPSLDVGQQLTGVSIPDLNNPLDQGLPNVSMPSVPGAETIGQTTEQIQSLQGTVPQDITSVDQLSKTAESQLMKIDEMKGIQEQLNNAPVNPLTSEEDAKKQLMNQAKEVAIDHFADKGEELKAAMDKISKYKQKFSNINSLSEITKRPPNLMKGKPIIERLVPGIQFQIQSKNGDVLVDFNPYVGYRINGRLTSGIGWNQRVAYTNDLHSFNPDARIFGPRAFSEFKLNRGFTPRLEIEVMNTIVPPFVVPKRMDIGEREWIFGAMVGIKKDYRFYKNIKGTATIMFNLLNHIDNKPYADVVNTRFGFEFPVKKKKRLKSK